MVEILQGFEFVFGCWHFKLSRPFTLSGRTYEVCLDCGKQFAYVRADLGQQSWPGKLEALGIQRGVSDENHVSIYYKSSTDGQEISEIEIGGSHQATPVPQAITGSLGCRQRIETLAPNLG
jgi:hypothetical protein